MPNTDELAVAFIDAVRTRFRESFAQIEHCVEQLDEDELHWRPFESHNSIANIMLHLCGNVRQWIIAGVGDTPDTRNRPAEFADRARRARSALRERLAATLDEADAALAALPPEELLRPRRIQGFEVTVLQAIVDTLGHFTGHVQEITYVARLRLGASYRFRWVPSTAEQGADAASAASEIERPGAHA